MIIFLTFLSFRKLAIVNYMLFPVSDSDSFVMCWNYGKIHERIDLHLQIVCSGVLSPDQVENYIVSNMDYKGAAFRNSAAS